MNRTTKSALALMRELAEHVEDDAEELAYIVASFFEGFIAEGKLSPDDLTKTVRAYKKRVRDEAKELKAQERQRQLDHPDGPRRVLVRMDKPIPKFNGDSHLYCFVSEAHAELIVRTNDVRVPVPKGSPLSLGVGSSPTYAVNYCRKMGLERVRLLCCSKTYGRDAQGQVFVESQTITDEVVDVESLLA